MLQDAPEAAPYGWSHCLTLPQAVLGVAPGLDTPMVAVAIAATYVLAFRTSQGSGAGALEPGYEPDPVGGDAVEALSAAPATAAAAAFHATGAEAARLVARLAALGAAHEDAHLAKYTLACFDAAARDPEQRRLYLAAATYLAAWWNQ